jgi:hypothetical protein
MTKRPLALVAAAAVAAFTALGLGSVAQSTPLAAGATAMPAAAPQYVVDVQYRRARRYVPRRYYYRRAYWPRRYYYRPYYPGPVIFAPWFYAPPPVYVVPRRVYVAPGPYRRCWIKTDDRGFGYWGACRR